MAKKPYGTNKCRDCGKRIGPRNLYCGECKFQHGEVYTLNFKNWRWKREER